MKEIPSLTSDWVRSRFVVNGKVVRGFVERDKQIEQYVQARTIKECPQCGNAYSFDPTFESDFGMCVECREEEGEIVGGGPQPGQKRSD